MILTLTVEGGFYRYTWGEPGLPINDHSSRVNLQMRELALTVQRCEALGSDKGHESGGSGQV